MADRFTKKQFGRNLITRCIKKFNLFVSQHQTGYHLMYSNLTVGNFERTNFLQKERNIITHLFLCNLFLIAAICIWFVFYLCLLYCKFLCIYFCRVPSQQCPHFVVGFICSRLDCICCLASRVLQICKICSSLYPVVNVEVK